MSRINAREISCGALLASLGAFCFYQSFTISVSEAGLIGPRLVPQLVSALLCLLGLAQLTLGMRRAPPSSAPSPGNRPLLIGLLLAAGLGYALLFSALGYLPATVIAAAVVLWLFGNRPWWRVALIAALTGIAYYAVFIAALGVYAPPGWLLGR